MSDKKILCLRVTVADQPGALAGMAGAIAALGANIVDIDVHGLERGRAVDDITVEVPASVSPMQLRARLLDAGALEVLSTGNHHRTSDAGARCLIAAAEMLEASEPPYTAVAGAAASMLSLERATVVTAPRDAVEVGAWSADAPVRHTTDDGSHVLLVMIADDGPLLRVERNGQAFTTAEVTRLRALARIARSATEADRRVSASA